MPTYEFRCPDGTIIERIYKISEVPDAIPVPDGDGMAVRIISGGAGLLFKGSGFYITDYGKDGKKDQRAASEAGKARESGDSGGAGDAKPSADSKSPGTPAPAAPATPVKSDTKSDAKSDARSE
jgi:predicted nucleic acid-binding Zn ribbon protein